MRKFSRFLRPRKPKDFISKTAQFSTKSGAKTKKKSSPQKVGEFWGETTKKGSLLLNLLKNSSCSQILVWQPVFWKSQASNCTPVTPSLLLSLGHTPSFGGHKRWFGGTRLRNVPTWRRVCWTNKNGVNANLAAALARLVSNYYYYLVIVDFYAAMSSASPKICNWGNVLSCCWQKGRSPQHSETLHFFFAKTT